MLSGVKQSGGGAAAPGAVIEVSERSFERDVIQRSRELPVVIDFWAPWCGPCRTLGPLLERLAAEAKGAWVLAKVNVDENPRLQAAFRIQSIPAVMAVFGGKVVEQFVGALPESQVRAWLKRFVPEQQEQGGSLLEAAEALAASDPQGAIDRYRLILGEEPQEAAALFGLGRLLLLQGDPEGVETLRQVPSGTPYFARAQAALPLAELTAQAEGEGADESEARYREAARAVRRGDYAGALEGLVGIVARDRAFQNDGARKAMLALLAALTDDHPLVPVYRRKLANTLF